LDKMPKLKEKMIDKLSFIDRQYAEEEGTRGQIEGQKTRMRLRRQYQEAKELKARQLDEMIQLTAQTNVMDAIKLSELLQPQWSEQPHTYKIISKIETQKQKNRLKQLTAKLHN